MKLNLAEIAKLVDGELIGDASKIVKSVSGLSSATGSDVAFVEHKKYLPALKETHAGVVLLRREHVTECPVAAVVTDRPYLAYARVAQKLFPRLPIAQGISQLAVIGENCQIGQGVSLAPHVVIGDDVTLGDGVQIGANTTIGEGVQIGANSVIYPNVAVYRNCRLGDDVIVHSGAIIGADGFGYAPSQQGWVGIPQLGAVVLGDGVEIGANTTIDRGAIDDTTIGNGVIIDNLVQIGHNVQIGEHTAIAACTAVAGSVKIGQRCTIAGAVGIAGHLTIVDQVHITGMTLVTHSIPQPGVYSSGVPMEANSSWHRNAVRFKQLDQMAKRLKLIEKKILNS